MFKFQLQYVVKFFVLRQLLRKLYQFVQYRFFKHTVHFLEMFMTTKVSCMLVKNLQACK